MRRLTRHISDEVDLLVAALVPDGRRRRRAMLPIISIPSTMIGPRCAVQCHPSDGRHGCGQHPTDFRCAPIPECHMLEFLSVLVRFQSCFGSSQHPQPRQTACLDVDEARPGGHDEFWVRRASTIMMLR